MINLENIVIVGYGSIINRTIFDLSDNGMHILKGDVGSGKTTLPSSIAWCLYGINLKTKSSIETWEHLRDDNYKGAMVSISLNNDKDSYEIIRCSSYKGKIDGIKGGNGLFIKKNGNIINENRNKADKQSFINDLLGMGFKLFTNTIIFGQNMKRIIEESGPDQKNILEEALRTTFINKAKVIEELELDKLNNVYSSKKNTLDNLRLKLKVRNEKYTRQLEYENMFNKLKKQKLEHIKKEIASNELLLELNHNKKSKLNFNNKLKLLSDKKSLDNEIKVLENRKYSNDLMLNKVESLKASISNKDKILNDIKISKCSFCGSKLHGGNHELLYSKVKNERDLLKEELDSIDIVEVDMGAITDLRIKSREISNKLNSIDSDKRANSELKGTILDLESNIKKLKNRVNKLKEEVLIYESSETLKKIKRLETITNRKEKDLVRLEKDIETKNWLIKKPLSNSGLKAFIFNDLLSEVNHGLRSFRKILGFEIEFGIDLETGRKDLYQSITKDGNIILYHDLSGGQKQLVNTAVAIVIHRVVTKSNKINLLFMDEPFENMDDKSTELVTELLEDISRTTNLYIITHKTGLVPITAKIHKFRLDKKLGTLIN